MNESGVLDVHPTFLDRLAPIRMTFHLCAGLGDVLAVRPNLYPDVFLQKSQVT